MRHDYGKSKALQHSFIEDRVKEEKDSKTIQVLEKYLKLTKEARIAVDNSNCSHSDSFEINTYKSKDNESVLSCSTQKNCLL